MKAGMYIQLEKLEAHPDAVAPTVDIADYKLGKLNPNKSLPVGYTLEGVLLRDIKVGESLFLERHKRNGVSILGMTETSEIVAIKDNVLITKNSIYQLTVLD